MGVVTDNWDFLAISRYIALLEQQAVDRGIRLEVRGDFGHFLELCREIKDKPYPTAMFDPLKADIGPHNGFYMKGLDGSGEVVFLQAFRIHDMNGTTLARSFEDLSAFYYDPELADPKEWCRSSAPVTKRIMGDVCYHGEIWLKGGKNGYRGTGLGTILPSLGMAIALLRWKPDFMYGFGFEGLIMKGVLLRYGYCHMQPSAIYWDRPYRDKPLEVWIVWMSRRDLVELFTLRGKELAACRSSPNKR